MKIKGTDIDVSYEEVTPAKAQKWLEESAFVNRREKHGRIKRMAMAITQGEWNSRTHEGIAFSRPQPDGTRHLLDGQNRLNAIILADKSVWMLIFRDLEIAAARDIDNNAPRNLNDMLVMRGEKSAKDLASVINTVVRYEQAGSKDASIVRSYSHSAQAALTWLDKHPEVSDSVRMGSRLSNKFRLSQQVGGFAHYVLSHLADDPALADDVDFFFERLLDPQHDRESGAFLIIDRLREAIVRQVESKQEGTAKVLRALLFKAWNHYVDGTGEDLSQLKWSSGTVRREPFPEPHWNS